MGIAPTLEEFGHRSLRQLGQAAGPFEGPGTAGHTFSTSPAAQAMTALSVLPTAGSWVGHPVTGSLGRLARPHWGSSRRRSS